MVSGFKVSGLRDWLVALEKYFKFNRDRVNLKPET